MHWVVLILVVLLHILVKQETPSKVERRSVIDAAKMVAAVLAAYHLAKATVRVL